jgi:hypothetical protein
MTFLKKIRIGWRAPFPTDLRETWREVESQIPPAATSPAFTLCKTRWTKEKDEEEIWSYIMACFFK